MVEEEEGGRGDEREKKRRGKGEERRGDRRRKGKRDNTGQRTKRKRREEEGERRAVEVAINERQSGARLPGMSHDQMVSKPSE